MSRELSPSVPGGGEREGGSLNLQPQGTPKPMPRLPQPVAPELQSPPWSEPEWAARLQNDVVGLTKHVTMTPEGVEWEDFLQEVRLVLVQRSWSPKSRWDPKRISWTSWVCMVVKSFSMNFHKRRKFRAGDTTHARDLEEAWGVAGSPLPQLAESAHYVLAPWTSLHPMKKERPPLSLAM